MNNSYYTVKEGSLTLSQQEIFVWLGDRLHELRLFTSSDSFVVKAGSILKRELYSQPHTYQLMSAWYFLGALENFHAAYMLFDSGLEEKRKGFVFPYPTAQFANVRISLLLGSTAGFLLLPPTRDERKQALLKIAYLEHFRAAKTLEFTAKNKYSLFFRSVEGANRAIDNLVQPSDEVYKLLDIYKNHKESLDIIKNSLPLTEVNSLKKLQDSKIITVCQKLLNDRVETSINLLKIWNETSGATHGSIFDAQLRGSLIDVSLSTDENRFLHHMYVVTLLLLEVKKQWVTLNSVKQVLS